MQLQSSYPIQNVGGCQTCQKTLSRPSHPPFYNQETQTGLLAIAGIIGLGFFAWLLLKK